MDTRLATVQTLLKVIRDQQTLTASMNLLDPALSQDKRPLYGQMCYGLLRHYHSLQKILSCLLAKPLARKHLDIELLILLGLYQLQFLNIPDHASVSQTVETTNALGKKWAKGLVNGVLRRFLRDRSSIIDQLQGDPVFRFDHPDWLISAIQQAWPSRFEQILDSNNLQAPMTLRVNQSICSREAFMKILMEEGMQATNCEFSCAGVTLDSPMDITMIPGYDAGWFSVQDEASQLAATLLDLNPGLSVLDACAAPGGKSSHILEMASETDLLCLEIDGRRIARLLENMRRLGLSATTLQGDALTPENWWNGNRFDRILLDAPCSATGIIRRHPDIKLLRKPSDIDKLALQQAALLASVWPLLKKDGLLVYSTCSILPQENHLTVAGFLSRTPDASERPIEDRWGIQMPVGRQLLPANNGHDGFYYARLQKT